MRSFDRIAGVLSALWRIFAVTSSLPVIRPELPRTIRQQSLLKRDGEYVACFGIRYPAKSSEVLKEPNVRVVHFLHDGQAAPIRRRYHPVKIVVSELEHIGYLAIHLHVQKGARSAAVAGGEP